MIPNVPISAANEEAKESPQPAVEQKAQKQKANSQKPTAAKSQKQKANSQFEYIGPPCNHTLGLPDGTVIPAHLLKDEAYIRRMVPQHPRLKTYFRGL